MPLVDLCFNFEWVMTSLWRHLSFLQIIVHISNSFEPTHFLFGTNVQLHKLHLLIRVKVTLHMLKVTGEGQRSQRWNKGYSLQTITYTDIIPGTKGQYNKRHLMTKAFLTLKQGQGQSSQTWRCLRSLNASWFFLFFSGLMRSLVLKKRRGHRNNSQLYI